MAAFILFLVFLTPFGKCLFYCESCRAGPVVLKLPVTQRPLTVELTKAITLDRVVTTMTLEIQDVMGTW